MIAVECYGDVSLLKRLFVIFGDTLNALKALGEHPAGTSVLSSNYGLREDKFDFGNNSYVRRLLPEIRTAQSPCQLSRFVVVRINDLGINQIQFLESLENVMPLKRRDEWLYALPMTDTLTVQSKVWITFHLGFA
jgi:hypothetical protein